MSSLLVRLIGALLVLVVLFILADRVVYDSLKKKADVEPFEAWLSRRYNVMNNEYSLKCYPHTSYTLRAVKKRYNAYVKKEVRLLKNRIEV